MLNEKLDLTGLRESIQKYKPEVLNFKNTCITVLGSIIDYKVISMRKSGASEYEIMEAIKPILNQIVELHNS